MTAVEAKIKDAQARRSTLTDRLRRRKQEHRSAEASFVRSIEQCIHETLELLRQEDELADLISQARPEVRAEQAPLLMQSYQRWLKEALELIPSMDAMGEELTAKMEFKRAVKRVRVLVENSDRILEADRNVSSGKGRKLVEAVDELRRHPGA